MNKKNIAIFTPYAEPEKGACSIRVKYLQNAIEKAGHNAKVFAPKREGIESIKKVERFAGILGIFNKAFTEKFDAFIGVSPPLPANFFVMLAAKIKGKPFVLDAKDDAIALLPFKGNAFKKAKHAIYMCLRQLVYRNAELLFFLTEEDRKLEIKRYCLKKEKTLVIPNGSDTSVIFQDMKKREETRKKLGINENDFAVIYAGTLGDEPLEKAIENISFDFSEKNKIKFIFVLTHDGSKHNKELLQALKNTVKKAIEEKTKIIINAEYNEMNAYFSAADIALLPWNEKLETSIPVKTYDYMAAGLPIIVKMPEKGALKRFIEENSYAFFAVNSWYEIEKAIKKAIETRKKNPEITEKERTFIEENFERKEISEKAVNEIIKLINKNK